MSNIAIESTLQDAAYGIDLSQEDLFLTEGGVAPAVAAAAALVGGIATGVTIVGGLVGLYYFGYTYTKERL